MASHTSITKPQQLALHKFLEAKLPKSIDKLVDEVGQEDAFRLLSLKERFKPEAE